MQYKSVLLKDDGKKIERRKDRKMGAHRRTIFLYNKKLSSVKRKERRLARKEAE